MPCYHPLTGYKGKELNNNGRRPLVFNIDQAYTSEPVKIPCGQCVGCRLERSRQWAIRCVHEASLYQDNCFITLTYNNKYLPEDKSLNKKHFQDFMKRLRRMYPEKKIRYYQCGEYGEKNMRPHYHACLFNFDFSDKKLWQTREGVKLYTSEILSERWGKGFVTIGEVTWESAAYVARYIMKKINGKQAEIQGIDGTTHYEQIDSETGEIHKIEKEYTTMSRKPGIASDWYKQYKKDVYPSDFITHNGKKYKPPKYYDHIFEVENPEEFAILKERRQIEAEKHEADNTPDRLQVKEKCKLATIKPLIRPYEQGE